MPKLHPSSQARLFHRHSDNYGQVLEDLVRWNDPFTLSETLPCLAPFSDYDIDPAKLMGQLLHQPDHDEFVKKANFHPLGKKPKSGLKSGPVYIESDLLADRRAYVDDQIETLDLLRAAGCHPLAPVSCGITRSDVPAAFQALLLQPGEKWHDPSTSPPNLELKTALVMAALQTEPNWRPAAECAAVLGIIHHKDPEKERDLRSLHAEHMCAVIHAAGDQLTRRPFFAWQMNQDTADFWRNPEATLTAELTKDRPSHSFAQHGKAEVAAAQQEAASVLARLRNPAP